MPTFTGTSGTDNFTVTAGRDAFLFTPATLQAGDSVDGGAGFDTLAIRQSPMRSFAANAFAGVRNIEALTLSGLITGGVQIEDATIGDAAGGSLAITIDGGAVLSGLVIDASRLSAGRRIDLDPGTSGLTARGGAGDDVFRMTKSALYDYDAGGGNDTLVVSSTVSEGTKFAGFENYLLTGVKPSLAFYGDRVTRNPGPLRIVDQSTRGVVSMDPTAATPIDVRVSDGRYYGGIGADIFRLGSRPAETIRGGTGSARDTLVLTAAGSTLDAAAMRYYTEVEQITLAAAGITVVIPDYFVSTAFGRRVVVSGSAGDDRVDARAVSERNSVEFLAGAGDDTLYGGAGDDTFHFDPADLTLADTIAGGAGDDRLLLRSAGAVTLGGNVSGIETLSLGVTGVSATLTDAFAAANPGRLAVRGDGGSQTLDASAVTRSDFAIETWSGAGDDVLRGGAGDDGFRFRHLDLTGTDVVTGGAGYDTLRFTTSGGINLARLAGVSGIERIVLAGGNDTVALPAALVASAAGQRVRVEGGAGRDTIDGGYVGAGSLELLGGDGDDTLLGSRGGDWIEGGAGADTLTGRGGADTFRFPRRDEAGARITDWTSADDTLSFGRGAFAFNGAGFDTVSIALTATDSLADADLARYTGGPIDSADALMAYLAQNGTGDAGAGMFVAANTSGNETVLYHVTDASGRSGDAVLVASFGGGTSPYSFRLDDFAFT